MLKTYLKKMLFTLIGGVIFAIFFGLEYLLITNFFCEIEGKLLLQYIMILIALLLSLFIILILRVKSSAKKEEYLELQKDTEYSLKSDLLFTLKSSDFTAEILVLLTICLPMFIMTGINSGTDFLPSVFATFVLTVLSVVLLIIFDIPLWIITHNNWNKG